MLARLLWPLQRIALQQRWVVDAAILLFVAVIAGLAMPQVLGWSAFSLHQRIIIGGALSALWYAAGRPGSALGSILAVALGALTAIAGDAQTAGGITLLIASTSALLLPLLYELRGARTHEDALSASALTMVMIIPGTLLLSPSWYLIGGLWLMVGGAVTMCASIFLPLSWCRLQTESAPINPVPITPRHQPIYVARMLQGVVLILVALGAIDVIGHAVRDELTHHGWWLWIIPVITMALWHGITGHVFMAGIIVLVTLGWMGYGFLSREPRHNEQLLIAFLLSQILPLALWLGRTRHRKWPSLLLITIGLLPALASEDFIIVIGGASMAGCLAVVVCAFRPLPPMPAAGIISADDTLTRVRRACQRLTPYWRHYGTAKLRYDPVYRQLAEQTMPFGRILDAGCGPGLIAAIAAVRHEPAYFGIDLDGDKLETALDILERLNRPLDDQWRFIKAKLPLPHNPPNNFDTIFILDVLHYWPESEQLNVLLQLHAALADNGKLWLRDGVSDVAGDTGTVGFGERFTTFFGLNPSGSGLHFLTEERMQELLTEGGFEIVSCEPSGAENKLWCCKAKKSEDE